MKIDQEEKINVMLKEAKIFVSNFDDIVSNLSEKDIQSYREKINKEK